MGLVNFAHNGVHHASEAEAAAHQLTGALWIVLAMAFAGAAVLTAVRLLSYYQSRNR